MSCNAQEPREDTQHQQVTQSTILYLLEEATKLSPPGGEENSSSSATRREMSRNIPKDSSSHSTGSFSLSSSAWEVMCLINQQCEWLLRSGDEDRTPADPTEITETPLAEDFSVVLSHFQSSTPAAFYNAQPKDIFTRVSDDDEEEEMKEPDSLAELIMNNSEGNFHMSEKASTSLDESRDESQDTDSVPLSAGSEHTDPEIYSVDFSTCLVSERDSEDPWLPLNVYKRTQVDGEPEDVNNNDPAKIQESPSSHGGCRRTQRKQPHPARSPDPQDPDVQGITFSMHPEMETSTDCCKLVITSNYSEEIRRLRSSKSGRCRGLQTSQRSSSSEEDSDSCGASRGKICASCLTRKTPLWRDAEDGTPLCNACGIRYKKYRVRCHHCWNIPKKDSKSNSKCLKCGDVLQQKYSSW